MYVEKYWAAPGVWVVREAARVALSRLEAALADIATRLRNLNWDVANLGI